MTIEESDFKLVPVDYSSSKFDLYLLKTIKPKGCASRQEMTLAAYGCPLESAILRIASYRIQSKHEDEAITLLQYLKELNKMIDKLNIVCHKESIDLDVEESNV